MNSRAHFLFTSLHSVHLPTRYRCIFHFDRRHLPVLNLTSLLQLRELLKLGSLVHQFVALEDSKQIGCGRKNKIAAKQAPQGILQDLNRSNQLFIDSTRRTKVGMNGELTASKRAKNLSIVMPQSSNWRANAVLEGYFAALWYSPEPLIVFTIQIAIMM
jgi:hypothetical protein